MNWTDFWNERYKVDAYVFGTEPNDFLRETAPRIPAGPVLCIAEGEGRNAVHLASLGHEVLAVDQSATGLAKAERLACSRGLRIQTVVSDLETFDPGQGKWSAIVSIFVHLPPALRAAVHQGIIAALRPGGLYIAESYTPAQLAYNTGGPKDRSLLPSLEDIERELHGLDFLIGRELERPVHEGSGHTGLAAVVQVLAAKPR